MAQKGRLVVCGDAGDALGDSIYEAHLYVRGSVAGLGRRLRREGDARRARGRAGRAARARPRSTTRAGRVPPLRLGAAALQLRRRQRGGVLMTDHLGGLTEFDTLGKARDDVERRRGGAAGAPGCARARSSTATSSTRSSAPRARGSTTSAASAPSARCRTSTTCSSSARACRATRSRATASAATRT